MTGSPESLAESLIEAICTAMPMQRNSLRACYGQLDGKERAELERYVSACLARGVDVPRLVVAYKTISEDTLREQVYFRRHGKYRFSTFEEVAGSVYFNDEYMQRYMYGLALTLYLWPNHLEILRYFDKALARAKGGSYLEVGPGHGAFFSRAIRSGKFGRHLGIDISPTSLALTRSLLESEGLAGWDLVESDFLAYESGQGQFDVIVMGEVLEHVEQPGLFLDQLRRLVAPGGLVFITTAVNAPAVDHIHLFSSVDEVRALAEGSRFAVLDVFAPPYHGCTMAVTIEQKLPINVAMVLEPK
ncbi:class I SAM-dependent methyltransferase [bacterium BD-1]|nr:class I SAM-dependent methyltransferase [Ottowia caeni]